MDHTRNLLILLFLAACCLIAPETSLATMPDVGTPPAPASNINPPAAFIGLLITFACIMIVVLVNLMPSKRKDVK